MNLKNALLLIVVMIIWGVNFSVIKIGLENIPSLLLTLGRFLLVVFPIIFFIPKPNCQWKWIVLFGLFSGALQFSFLFFGIELGASPGLASVVLQLHVFFTLVLSVLFFKNKLSRGSIIGISLGFLGMIFLTSHMDNTNLYSISLIILAALSWAFANIITKKVGEINMFSFIIWSSIIPVILLFMLSLYKYNLNTVINIFNDIDLYGVFSLFYLSYLTTIFGYGIWSRAIKHYDIGKVVPFTLSVPIVGIISDKLIFGKQFTQEVYLSVILVLLGLLIILLEKQVYNKLKNFISVK